MLGIPLSLLSSGLEYPFREQLQQSFDAHVTSATYGVKPEVLAALQDAVHEGRRVRVLYTRSADWTQSWRTIDPRRLYIRHRAVYLYARTADETPPEWKIFRLGRMAEVRPTGESFTWDPMQNDGFEEKKNAFSACLRQALRRAPALHGFGHALCHGKDVAPQPAGSAFRARAPVLRACFRPAGSALLGAPVGPRA